MTRGVPLAATKEGIFFAGQVYDAMSNIADLVEGAKVEVWVVDTYFGREVLDVLSAKSPEVKVKVLAGEAKPAFRLAAQKFNEQYGGLEVRTTSAFHDRFIVVDDSAFYHFGASLKDAGKRGFMFSRIEEPRVIELLWSALTEAWHAASPVLP